MGLFNYLIRKKQFSIMPTVNNITLQRCIDNMKRWETYEDTVYCTTSRTCLTCSIYERRVFSLYGKDKRFPNFQNMPIFLRESQCPECGKVIGYTNYFPDINNQHLQRDIELSNRPFVADESVLEFARESERKQKERKKEETDYLWVTNNLPKIAPKSLAGFRRMKNSNSKNFQEIVNKALEKGYEITK